MVRSKLVSFDALASDHRLFHELIGCVARILPHWS